MIIGRNKKKALQESLHDASFLYGFSYILLIYRE